MGSQVGHLHLHPRVVSVALHIAAIASMVIGMLLDSEHPYRAGLATIATVMGTTLIAMLWLTYSNREREPEMLSTYVWYVIEFATRTLIALPIGTVIVWLCVGAFDEKHPGRAELYGGVITVVLWLLSTRELYHKLEKDLNATE